MRSMFTVIGLGGVLAALAANTFGGEGEVSYFRADRGVAADASARLPDDLDAPDVLRWKQPIDAGHSTPCAIGGRVFLTTFDG